MPNIPADIASLVLQAFRKASSSVPAYKDILNKHGIEAKEVQTLSDFQSRVPIIDKKMTFLSYHLAELCVDGNLDTVVSLLPSSGFSGGYSYGVITSADTAAGVALLDEGLKRTFDLGGKPLIVNTLGMGVTVQTSFPSIQTGTRSDIVLETLARLQSDFTSFVLIGDPLFIKQVIDEGADKNYKWGEYKIFFILGGDWFPESFRQYLMEKTGYDRSNILSSMGIAEIGLNVLFESPISAGVRVSLAENPAFLKSLGFSSIPLLFHYDPSRIFIETISDPLLGSQLVFTTLDTERKLPLIRYLSKDQGVILDKQFLGLLPPEAQEKYAPLMPLVAMQGRSDAFVSSGEERLYTAEVLENLFKDVALATFITGQFFLRAEEGFIVELQLRQGVEGDSLGDKFKDILQNLNKTSVRISLCAYDKFPHQMAVDYQRKPKRI